MAKKRGKYAEVIGTLKRDFGVEPGHEEKISGLIQQILNSEPAEKELSTDALEDMLMEVSAMLSIINDALIKGMGGKLWATRVALVYKQLRMVKAVMEEQEKITNSLLAAYAQILVNQYEAEGVTNLQLEEGGAVRYQEEPHAKVVDKEANRKWAQQAGLENLLTIQWNVLNAMTKEMLLKGEDAPPGVEVVARPKIVFSKNG